MDSIHFMLRNQERRLYICCKSHFRWNIPQMDLVPFLFSNTYSQKDFRVSFVLWMDYYSNKRRAEINYVALTKQSYGFKNFCKGSIHASRDLSPFLKTLKMKFIWKSSYISHIPFTKAKGIFVWSFCLFLLESSSDKKDKCLALTLLFDSFL